MNNGDYTIERRGLGYTEQVSFLDFVDFVIQDEEIAVEIARTMLKDSDIPYAYYEDQPPEYYQEFTVTNTLALEWQVNMFEQGGKRRCPICAYNIDDYEDTEVCCGACVDNYTVEAAALGDPVAIALNEKNTKNA